MKVKTGDLSEIIKKLPDPDTYPYHEYKTMVLEPIECRVSIESPSPQEGKGTQIIFKKHRDPVGKYYWYMEY